MRTQFLLGSFAAVCLFFVPADAAWFGPKQRDVNKLLVFPTIAYPSRLTGEYKVDLHAIAIDTGSGDGPAGKSMFSFVCPNNDTSFNERWAPFTASYSAGAPMSAIVWNEGRSQRINLNPIGKNGHLEQSLSISSPRQALSINMDVTVQGLDSKTLTAHVRKIPLAPHQGWGVISDIDDTIKISQVLSITKMIDRAFCQEYVPLEGMPEFYTYLNDNLKVHVENRRVSWPVFYYLSGSPWQLLHPITDFMHRHFPRGEIILDELNVRCVKSLIHARDVIDYKKNHIRSIFKKFPDRKWLLIGDASEHDPEIYASIHEEFPGKVCHILIRLVEGTNPAVESQKNSYQRFHKTFAEVPAFKWSQLTPKKIEQFIGGDTPRDFKISNCNVLE